MFRHEISIQSFLTDKFLTHNNAVVSKFSRHSLHLAIFNQTNLPLAAWDFATPLLVYNLACYQLIKNLHFNMCSTEANSKPRWHRKMILVFLFDTFELLQRAETTGCLWLGFSGDNKLSFQFALQCEIMQCDIAWSVMEQFWFCEWERNRSKHGTDAVYFCS